MSFLDRLVFVDCEAWGGAPSVGQLTEFGAIIYHNRETFHGVIVPSKPSIENPAVPEKTGKPTFEHEAQVFANFAEWLKRNVTGEPKFVSDNIAYDWMWINDGFWRTLGRNPFGHSGRRISDFYAGLCGDFSKTQKWKRLRITKHDHHPVHDALGNLEAFQGLLNGKR